LYSALIWYKIGLLSLNSDIGELHYRALLTLMQGQQSRALELVKKIKSDFAEEWMVYLSLGDIMVRISNYDQANASITIIKLRHVTQTLCPRSLSCVKYRVIIKKL